MKPSCATPDTGLAAILRALHSQGERFVAQIPERLVFWPSDVPLEKRWRGKKGFPPRYPRVMPGTPPPRRAAEWAQKADQENLCKRFVLPQKKQKFVHAATFRVREATHGLDSPARETRPGLVLWLVLESLRDGMQKYFVSNLGEDVSLMHLLRLAHQRWAVEQSYQELKEELGLDHFEGRTWQGLHHHVAMTFLAYGFLMLLKHRRRHKRRAHGPMGAPVAQPPSPVRHLS